MNELIKITVSEGGKRVVSGRELYALMGVKTPYRTWIKRMIGYGFKEGKDYQEVTNKFVRNGRPPLEHAITAHMAKEVSMIQNTPESKLARKYFIAVEEKALEMYNKPPTALEIGELYVAALKREVIAQKQLAQAEELAKANEPKVAFADSVIKSEGSILIREYAKTLSNENFTIGQNRLFRWFRDHNYLSGKNEPYQSYIDRGFFERIARTVGDAEHFIEVFTTYITGKGQVYFAEKIKGTYETT